MAYEKFFKALSDEKRIKILRYLNKNGKTCVCTLVDYLEISQSKLSYHLKMLLSEDIILKESQGKWNYYSLNEEKLLKVFVKDTYDELLDQH